jgi:hypothetical protein
LVPSRLTDAVAGNHLESAETSLETVKVSGETGNRPTSRGASHRNLRPGGPTW